MAESEGSPQAEDDSNIQRLPKEDLVLIAGEWTKNAAEKVLAYSDMIRETVRSTIEPFKSRLVEIFSTSAAHSQISLDLMREAASDLKVYEEAAFSKVKEGITAAASHPLGTGAVTLTVGALVLKRPRRFMYYTMRRVFVRQEAMLSQAETKVKELRHSFNILKVESEKLEKSVLFGEEEFNRGRTKLKQAGKQIQVAINSAYKIQREADGLKDLLRDVPTIEASKFGKQVKTLASEVKQEKALLTKEVNKINNYGISV